MKYKKYILTIIFGLIYVSLMAFFTYKCLEDGNKSLQSSNKVAEVIKDVANDVFDANIKMEDSYITLIRKLVGHFGFFLVLGCSSILFYLSLRRGTIVTLMYHYIVGFMFALLSEFCFEGNTSGRTASFKDVMIDYSGFILISTIIVLVYYFVIKRRKVKYEKQKTL